MRIHLVEDHEGMRIILKRLLRKNFAAITEIGESGSAEAALDAVPRLDPDLVLIDISLPGMDGIELTRRLRAQRGDRCLLIVTGHELAVYEQDALAAGVDGIVSKFDDDKLLHSVQEIIDRHQHQGGNGDGT